ncbi:hypothetical protein [Roseiconus lacunae]|uniref:hypothetical protein n=1 Tax=Roseiconus lacunae TaxID=2605694 RepID=UPI0011F149DA
MQVFSLSFLDLISCAMAGVLVLYAVAERPVPVRDLKIPAILQIEIPETSINAVFVFHLRNGTEEHFGDTTNGGGGWIVTDSSAVLKLENGLDEAASLSLGLRDIDLTSTNSSQTHNLHWRVVSEKRQEENDAVLSPANLIQVIEVGK